LLQVVSLTIVIALLAIGAVVRSSAAQPAQVPARLPKRSNSVPKVLADNWAAALAGEHARRWLAVALQAP
jgi:hypothetical protein